MREKFVLSVLTSITAAGFVFLIICILAGACGPLNSPMVQDLVNGELDTMEKLIQDMRPSGENPPPKG